MKKQSKYAKIIRMGYGDLFGKDVRLLDFKTEWMPKEEAVKVIPLVKGYNEFSGKNVAKVLQKLQGVKSVKFGRESSPVMYISADEKFKTKIRKALAKTKPDEISEEFGNMRFWWD